ncbi:MAG: alpha,alpha-trehalase TreF [Steroidobacterales bacterium]
MSQSALTRRGILTLCLLVASAIAGAESAVRTPADLYGELFVEVQSNGLLGDSKTFADAEARAAPESIVADFQRERQRPDFDLKAFVVRHFNLPADRSDSSPLKPEADVADHIDRLWDVLTRAPEPPRPYSSLLPLSHPYVVPGGRFREIYYWDSYFTMLGLEASHRHDLALAMLANFAELIDRYGHVPNGNRSYYLSRSQPPFFAAMVELVAASDGVAVYPRYLPDLQREYDFWMDGAERVARGNATRRVVRLKGGAILNRYWDDRDTPREESYREDVATARGALRPAAETYRNLRAAAESGWDFSSRWFADGRTLVTIHTTDLVPVDLNSLLYQLELTLAKGYDVAGDTVRSRGMKARAAHRREAMDRYLWDRHRGAYTDYDWHKSRRSDAMSAATLYPLFFNAASREQSSQVARYVREHLLQPGGVATTTVVTGQQWDAPNGWAPLQWIAVAGLRSNGEAALARLIACRWMRENIEAYRATAKLVEKYDISGSGAGRGGEYPLQDGFGWTNGVLRRLLLDYPSPACETIH